MYCVFLIINIVITFILLLLVHSYRFRETDTDEWKDYSLPRYVYIILGIFCWVPFLFAINIVIVIINIANDRDDYYLEPKPWFIKLRDFFVERL